LILDALFSDIDAGLLGGGDRPVLLLTASCYNARLEGDLANWKD
jgi:hypothetical protein